MSKTKTGMVQIVVAWTEQTQELAPGQKTWRHDLGERPRFVDVVAPRAAMWLNSGDGSDIDKAQRWIAREHPNTGRVLAYPLATPDPLDRARRDVLKTAKNPG